MEVGAVIAALALAQVVILGVARLVTSHVLRLVVVTIFLIRLIADVAEKLACGEVYVIARMDPTYYQHSVAQLE